MLRATTGPWRTACWAVGGQVPPRGSGAAAQSPIAQTESGPRPAGGSSTGTRPRSSSGTLSCLRLGCGATPAVQTTVGSASISPVESVTESAPDLFSSSPAGCRCRGRAARARRSRRAPGRSPAGRGPRLDQHPAHPVQAGAGVAVHRVGGEVLELGQRLEPGVAAADEDVGEQLLARAGDPRSRWPPRGSRSRGCAAQIASARLLKPIACSVRPGIGSEPRDRAEREQQLVVGDRLVRAVVGAQLDRLRLGIVAGDRTEPQVGALEDVAQRRDHVARLERPGGSLGQERRVERKLTSLTRISRADCFGRTFSSSRAAASPPNPPPAMTMFQAMARS